MRRLLLVLLIVSILVLPVLLVLERDQIPGRPQVALIEITGLIQDTNSDSPWGEGGTGARDVVHYLRTVQESPRYAAVIVRIDSGGGSPAAAQEIYAAIRHTRALNKPVVASMGEVATSAAYYIAAAADAIVANPSTLTGSIGAIMEIFIVEDLLERWGIDTEVIVSGPYKDSGSPFRALDPRERTYFQELVDDVLDQFINDVAQGRGLDVEAVRALADGRVFSGRQAHALGLVDHLGGLEQAITVAAELAGLQERPVVVPLRKPRSFYDRLLDALGNLVIRTLRGHIAPDAWNIESTGHIPLNTLDRLGVPPWGYRLR